ncbi:MAG: alpha/beta fold hydrolase [Archangium sp.]
MSELFFRDEGEGEPMLLIHGLGAQSRVFDPVFEKRGTRRLIAIDLPRTARSGKWASSTPEKVASALLPFLETRGVKKFSVFGHSFGGLVALELATRVPQRITALNIASAPAVGLPREFKFILSNPIADWTMNWMGSMPTWRPMLKAYLQLIWGEKKPSNEMLGIYEEATQSKGFYDGMLEALRGVSAFKLEHHVLRELKIPKRVIWGEKDRLVPVMQGEQLATAMGVQLEVVNDIGHCLPEESPETVISCLTQ